MSNDKSRLNSVLDVCEELIARGESPNLEALCGGDASLYSKAKEIMDLLCRFEARFGEPSSSKESTDATLPWRRHTATCSLPEMIGDYRVLELLGQGGQGMVYLCRRVDPPAPVAVKVLGPRGSHEVARARFQREKELLSKLRHPGIAQVFDAGISDLGFGPTPYLVMEYIPGQNLDAYVRQHALAVEPRLELFISVCEAIEYAHSMHVIHRDIKPGNVLIDRWGRAKVIDFGVAHVTKLSETPGDLETVVQPGTRRYMTPEHLSGGQAMDRRSDVYALGVVAFELVTGELPYSAGRNLNSFYDLEEAIRNDPPRSIRELNSRLPKDLDTILKKALSKEPDRRYATVSEFADDLSRLLDKRPILARPPGTLYRARKFVERNRLLTASTSAIILTLAVGLAGTGIGLNRARVATNEAREAAADLALDRGDWETALSQLGHSNDNLDLPSFPHPEKAVRAALNAGRYENAERILRAIEPATNDKSRAEWLLLAADLALSKDSDIDRGVALAKEALAVGGLSESESWYAKGLAADSSVDAAKCLERAVSLDSRNYRAQLSLATARFFLGRHEALTVQTSAMNQLFSKEDAPQRLATISTALSGYSTDSTPTFLAKYVRKSFPVAAILDQATGSALKDKEDHQLLVDLLTALQGKQANRNSLLGRFLAPTADTSFHRVIAATRHVPAVARAWIEFDSALEAYWNLGHCSPEIMSRIDRAAASHPEAMILFTQGTCALDFPAQSRDELLARVIRSEKAFAKASEADAILTQVQVDARVQAVMAQYVLGTDHAPYKAEMAQKALENIGWLIDNDKMPTKYARTFSGYALTLGDTRLAADVAKWLAAAQPRNLTARVQAGTAFLAAGDFAQAIRCADEVLASNSRHEAAKELREKAITGATELVQRLNGENEER